MDGKTVENDKQDNSIMNMVKIISVYICYLHEEKNLVRCYEKYFDFRGAEKTIKNNATDCMKELKNYAKEKKYIFVPPDFIRKSGISKGTDKDAIRNEINRQIREYSRG